MTDPKIDKQRLAEIFGDVLPSQTSDDQEVEKTKGAETWLLDQVPPHHG